MWIYYYVGRDFEVGNSNGTEAFIIGPAVLCTNWSVDSMIVFDSREVDSFNTPRTGAVLS